MAVIVAALAGAILIGDASNDPATPAAPPRPAGGYSGRGEMSVGTIRVRRESVLRWTATGPGLFAIANAPTDGPQIALVAPQAATSGRTVLQPGVYHGVDVLTARAWSFTIDPH